MNKALKYVFKQDKEFQQYRKENADAKITPSLRVKKPGFAAVKGKGSRKQPLAIAQ